MPISLDERKDGNIAKIRNIISNFDRRRTSISRCFESFWTITWN